MSRNARRWAGRAGGLACALAALVPLAGCPSKQNPVLSNERFADERHDPQLIMDSAQRATVVAAMQSTVAGGAAPQPLTRAEDGMRWSDVPLAASIAAEKAEMGVLSSSESESKDTWTFSMVTLDSVPVSLVVVRRPPPDMFLATATVGAYGERKAEAERLVRHFRMTVKDLGRKRETPDPPAPARSQASPAAQPAPGAQAN
ncbi:MAG: DTW domain-containing protein [Phycisphaerales bacterium]|nr:DTW domain-containing protein [Phycisphaerales bacterium]